MADAQTTGTTKPRQPGRLVHLGRWIREHYLTIDPRTLGLFRLVLGFLLAADCVRHWREADWLYSNEGVLTNHYHLFRPSSGYNFSIYHAFSSLGEVHVAFALSTLAYLTFCVGYKTRLFNVISFVLVTSMDNRLVMVENGGYVVVNLITGWAMFLPTGQRFSVDAWLRSWRERTERNADELNDRTRPRWLDEPYVSLAVLLVLLNFATIYFFNVVNKTGAIWKRGETVHFVLHLDRMVTGIAVFFRELLPFWVTRIISWGVLVLEALLVPWILSPYGRRVTRPLVILGVTALNGTFGIMMRLGPFSWFLLCWSLLMLAPVHWEMAEAWYRRRAAPRVVVFDSTSPLALAVCRVLKRLDLLELLRFEAGDSTIFLGTRDPSGGPIVTGVTAFRSIAQALPAGRWLGPLANLLTFGALGRLLDWLAANRERAGRFIGVNARKPAPHPWRPPSPLGRIAATTRAVFRELLLVYLGVCAVSQVLRENKAVPAFLREHKRPQIIEATIVTFRIFQGWGMFAPNPITEDGTLAVDAWTIDGRRIDPFTSQAPDLDLSDARGLGMGQLQQDYFNRIRFDRNRVFRQGLREYLERYHQRTGRPEDELVAFDVYWVRDQCPKPGSNKPYKNEAIPILTWRKPNFKPPPGFPTIPPEPKVESAGN